MKMAQCEMCGKETNLVKADVEGVELNVCSACSKYGTVKKKFSSHTGPRGKSNFKHKQFRKEKPELRIVHNYSSLIRSTREAKSMTQEDFAKLLNERESVVAKWESGNLRPNLNVARKLERKLGVVLIENDKKSTDKVELKKKKDSFTLGDFIHPI